MKRGVSTRPLAIEEIKAIAETFKGDLQREANRAIRRHNSSLALVALEGIEYINRFVFSQSLRAGSRVGFPASARPIHLFKKRWGAS
jgi:hypothetical protein